MTAQPAWVESELQRALDCGELVRVYQPVVDLRTGAPRYVEALLRWEHREHGLLAPDAFLAADEADALLVRIGWSVVIEAARRAHDWRVRFPAAAVTVSVNVFPAHLDSRDFGRRVESLVRDNDVVGRPALALELGEATVFGRGRAVDRLRAVRNLGVEVVVDDFGAAAASAPVTPDELLSGTLEHLGVLSRLPIDVLKLDRGFADRLAAHPAGTDAVAAVVARAQEVGVSVVATMVEDDADLSAASGAGFDLAQGFHLGRPQPPGAIEAALAALGVT